MTETPPYHSLSTPTYEGKALPIKKVAVISSSAKRLYALCADLEHKGISVYPMLFQDMAAEFGNVDANPDRLPASIKDRTAVLHTGKDVADQISRKKDQILAVVSDRMLSATSSAFTLRDYAQQLNVHMPFIVHSSAGGDLRRQPGGYLTLSAEPAVCSALPVVKTFDDLMPEWIYQTIVQHAQDRFIARPPIPGSPVPKDTIEMLKGMIYVLTPAAEGMGYKPPEGIWRDERLRHQAEMLARGEISSAQALKNLVGNVVQLPGCVR